MRLCASFWDSDIYIWEELKNSFFTSDFQLFFLRRVSVPPPVTVHCKRIWLPHLAICEVLSLKSGIDGLSVLHWQAPVI